ncbi:MAG: hypothetical protein LQ352_005365 [Teloschistes flavicans]|nr:MAG: hypothetical protein LQ352_005365 [Teloschistes flavicans]
MAVARHFIVATAIGLLLSVISYLLMTKHQRRFIYKRLQNMSPLTAQSQHQSPSKSPSDAGTPEKKVPSNNAPPAEYKEIFPPWRRDSLWSAARSSPFAQKDQLHAATDGFVDTLFRDGLLSFTADYRTCASPALTYTPMGISVSEIAALGDFPNYAELSGVPLPKPYSNFHIETALPRPYRPFRWAYHQTMSLTKLETDWWLEVEKSYVKRVTERKALFTKHGKQVLDYLPGSELGCKELMEMSLQFLCARYPQYFSLTYSEDKGHIFHNRLLQNETVIREMHPLHVLLENVPEDFAVMVRNPEDGYYYFRAGLLCSSLGWSVATKLGLQLKEIHKPIPDYKEKMEFSMDRYSLPIFTSLSLSKNT